MEMWAYIALRHNYSDDHTRRRDNNAVTSLENSRNRKVCWIVALVFACTLCAAEMSLRFTALFNGRDLSGWREGEIVDHRDLMLLSEGVRAERIAKWSAAMTAKNAKTGKPHWAVVQGELVGDGFGGYASTEKDYEDFELCFECKTEGGAEASVYLRGAAKIAVSREGTPGNWISVRLLLVGSHLSVWLNGELVRDHVVLVNNTDQNLSDAMRRPIPNCGPIQLASSNGVVRWRKVAIREIGSDEACRILAIRGAAGFETIFNGRDLEGWKGPRDAFAIRDGALVWRDGKRGTVYWDKELGDFQVRLFFKLPPGGNNGLAIRYPGVGAPYNDGMCEVQVLDDNYEKVRGRIDPRQAHGSAYGMVAAARGYQHPIGEWNFQEVSVKGSRVRVELNGTVILDTDLADVDMSTVKDQHPGRLRSRGFFGFAGHDDPVEFKDILIKEL